MDDMNDHIPVKRIPIKKPYPSAIVIYKTLTYIGIGIVFNITRYPDGQKILSMIIHIIIFEIHLALFIHTERSKE